MKHSPILFLILVASLAITACDPLGVEPRLPATPSQSPAASPSPALSGDACLASLVPSSGSLVPSFSPDTTSYQLDLHNSVASLSLSGSPRQAAATLSANNGQSQALPIGDTTITVSVTAPDGVATKDYQVLVHRSANYVSATVGTLVYVPAGRFQRDATATNISAVSPFRIGKHEVSRSQWLAVMGSDPSDSSVSAGTSSPVQNFSWYQALVFCNKLSLAEGLTPVYSLLVAGVDNSDPNSWGTVPSADNATWNAAKADWSANGYRLPTEMEWLWAAMGAPADGQGVSPKLNTTGYAKAFAGSDGSNDPLNYAWYVSNAGGKSQPVGTKLPNELGLYDMSGNVREFPWDWQNTTTGENIDYHGPTSGTLKSPKAGGYAGAASNLQLTSVTSVNAYYSYNNIGIRLVRN